MFRFVVTTREEAPLGKRERWCWARHYKLLTAYKHMFILQVHPVPQEWCTRLTVRQTCRKQQSPNQEQGNTGTCLECRSVKCWAAGRSMVNAANNPVNLSVTIDKLTKEHYYNSFTNWRSVHMLAELKSKQELVKITKKLVYHSCQ